MECGSHEGFPGSRRCVQYDVLVLEKLEDGGLLVGIELNPALGCVVKETREEEVGRGILGSRQELLKRSGHEELACVEVRESKEARGSRLARGYPSSSRGPARSSVVPVPGTLVPGNGEEPESALTSPGESPQKTTSRNTFELLLTCAKPNL